MSPSEVLRAATYLLVPDVAAAGAYYERALGFHCDYAAGNPPEFAIYSRGGLAVMFRRAPDGSRIVPKEAQGGTWDAFCWVESVDGLYDELKSRGATFAYHPVVQPYGMKEFAVRDPTGYVLGFGQDWQS
ncbi:MAG TPA: VOC family protein [Gemmatimonadales bacterium]